MDDQTQAFGKVANQAMTGVAASLGQSTKDSNSSEAHKRHFLQTFRRWEILFKRKDGDVESDKWLIAEYYKSLSHLSEAGMDALTEALKAKCVFFPAIKECLDATKPGAYEYGHPFYLPMITGDRRLFKANPPTPRLAAPAQQQISYDDE